MNSTSCYHCGLPVDDPAAWVLTVEKQQQSFCCPACQTVAETIVAGGFENYYRYRSENPDRPEGLQEQYQVYDDDVMQKSFVRSVDETTWEAELFISDIHCAACCWLIESALKQEQAIESIQVSLATHKLFVRWNKQALKLSDIFSKIANLGYKPLPFVEDQYQSSIERENRQHLKRLGVAGLAMMQVGMLSIALYAGEFQGIAKTHEEFIRWFGWLLCVPVVFYSASPFFQGALRSLKSFTHNITALGMDVPVSLAIGSAFLASTYGVLYGAEVYFDSIVMFVFLLSIARFIESRSRQQYLLRAYQGVLPVSARRLENVDDFQSAELSPVESIQAGEKVLVLSGETIPFDGFIEMGQTQVNEAAFTGEQLPRSVSIGDQVFAGTIIGDGPLVVRVSASKEASRFARVEQLVAKGSAEKPAMTLLVNRIAGVFTLIVLALALFSWFYWSAQGSGVAFEIVLAVLVVSCPCALSLATPAAMTFSYYALRQVGIVLSRGHVQETIKHIDYMVMDKTGTLTEGEFSLSFIDNFSNCDEQSLKELAAALESASEHPIAKAFKEPTQLLTEELQVLSGKGVEGVIDGKRYRIGSREFCNDWFEGESGADKGSFGKIEGSVTQQVFLADEKQLLCMFVLQDHLREGAGELVAYLKAQHIELEILSGDAKENVEWMAKFLGIPYYQGGMSPEDKLQRIDALQKVGRKVLMLGDGINDVPVLAQADVSIAMAEASDLAKLKADGVLLSAKLNALINLFSHSQRTVKVIRQNIAWALAYNLSALPLAALGFVPPWMAAIGMSLSSILVTCNAMRLKQLKQYDVQSEPSAYEHGLYEQRLN